MKKNLEEEKDIFYDEDIKKSEIIEQSFYDYASYIGKYEVLSPEEQIELIRRYQKEKDQDAFKKLINHNLKLAIFIAKKFINNCQNLTLFDLIQEANIALITAIKKYDLNTKTKPSAYIETAMMNNLIRELTNKGNMIRIPVYLSETALKYRNFIEKYYKKTSCYPTEEEIIKELNISKNQFNILNKKIKVDEVEAYELLSIIIDENNDRIKEKENDIDLKILLSEIKEKLSPREYYVIYSRYVLDEPKKLSDIAKEFGVTWERVQQIEADALFKLRHINKNPKNIKKNNIKRIMSISTRPMTPKDMSVYAYLKKNLDQVTYYFIYKRRNYGYSVNDFKKEFINLTTEEIIDEVKFCEEVEKEVFTDTTMSTIYNNVTKEKPLSKISRENITPTYSEEKFKKEEWSKKIKEIKQEKSYYKNIYNIDKKENSE